jgi:hypothetical protein
LNQVDQGEFAEAHRLESERWTGLVTAIDEAIDNEGKPGG